MTASIALLTCGTEPLQNARFCHRCGSPVAESATHAEYKQVTVLFADVVHSLDIAAAVDPERLREIMTDLVNRAAVVVQRYGGTVNQFTGDVRERDGVDLQLRVGLNSGQVIAGEIGSGPFGYTAVGEQVGMAQRMESVAAPGGV